MGVTVNVKDEQEKIKDAITKARHMQVLVGITQEKSMRPGEISNAELLFIHTNGSPINNVPPRPVIEPAIEHDKDAITDLLGKALKCVLEGDVENAKQFLNAAGLEGQGAAMDWFDNPDNGWPPNSPRTVAMKIKKGSTDPKPLIDTGELRKSITYVVREK